MRTLLSNLLSNETVFISGATSGFGEATAKLLASHGAKVIICGRRIDRLEALRQEIGKERCHIVVLDVQEVDKVAGMLSEIPAEFLPITCLVNNAGLALGLEPAHNCRLEDWITMINTNIQGLTALTHTLLPSMVERNYGYIINIGSIAGTYPYPGGNVYGASKAFVRQFSLNLKADLLGTAVRVTNIEPGIAETEFSLVRFKGSQERSDRVYDKTQPLTAEDIAETIFWCLTRPPHVNINSLELMPTAQASAALAIARGMVAHDDKLH